MIPSRASEPLRRPSYIGIHRRDDSTQVLFVSHGCFEAVGYPAEYLTQQRARDFIADMYDSEDYAMLYADQDEADEASVYVMYVNVKTASGTPVLHRTTSFKCNSCVVYIGVTFPEVPFINRNELMVQMLDGAKQGLNVTRERRAHTRAALFCSQSSQVRVAFVLENPSSPVGDGTREYGSLVRFVTASVSRLVDADTSDLIGFPFLKLVAPEDLVHVTQYFARLSQSDSVVFDKFSLLSRPPVVLGDVSVADADNRRVLVECLGATVPDGVAMLLRKISVAPAAHVPGEEPDAGYMSLLELVSSDPETTNSSAGWCRVHRFSDLKPP